MSTPAPATVDELPADPGGGDFYAPLFLTLTPDGQIAFDFDGHIRAKGLDIEAHDVFGTEPLPHSTIRWLREADDVQSARMHGVASGADSSHLLLDAFGGGIVRRYARFALVAGGPIDLTGVSAALEIFDGVGLPFMRILIDASQRSDFLQLADGPADVRYGRATVVDDPPSIPAHSASAIRAIAVADVEAGDAIIAATLGVDSAFGLVLKWEATVATSGEVRVRYFNADSVTVDSGPVGLTFHYVKLG